MKAKTLMTMAVAGTFGLSAAAFAENAHAGFTPFSANESGDAITALKDHQQLSARGSTSHDVTASAASESYSESSSATASLGMGESLALADDGVYSDYYIVSWTPVMVESWDVYLIDMGSADELAAADSISMPRHELATVSSQMSSVPSGASETAS